MSALQAVPFRPQIDVKKVSYFPCITTAHVKSVSRSFLNLTTSRPKYRRSLLVCAFEDSGNSEYSNQEPSDNPGGKKLSLEEILRRQIEKQEYGELEGSGGSPPSDGGGGGRRGRRGRGGGADSGGSEEEQTPAEQLDELLQVTLATTGLILLYAYILHGPEITRLAKDYLRYLFTGSRSVRLKRAMYVMGRFCMNLTRKKKVVSPETSMDLLQHQILTTPTWFDSPSKYRHIVVAYTASKLAE